MKAKMNLAVLGALVRPLTLRNAGGTDIAEGTIGVESIQNGRKQTNYIPVVVVGNAAKPLFERTQAGSVLAINGAIRQEKWDGKDGEKHARVRLQALRTEVITGEHNLVTDSAGGFRLADGINFAELSGNLTATPTLRKTPGGDTVTDFGLALNETYQDRQGNEQKRTTYVQVVVWNDLAHQVANMQKGQALNIFGCLTSDSWTTPDGQKRSTLKVEAMSVCAVDIPKKNEQPQGDAKPEGDVKAEAAAQGETFKPEDDLPANFDPASTDAQNEDDLPF